MLLRSKGLKEKAKLVESSCFKVHMIQNKAKTEKSNTVKCLPVNRSK